jgi:hypothetical protein
VAPAPAAVDMAPFAEILRAALENLIVEFRGMTAGVTAGYAEVARMRPLRTTTPHRKNSRLYFLTWATLTWPLPSLPTLKKGEQGIENGWSWRLCYYYRHY